ncbi:MAG: Coq4 family protein [Cystobacter sp.]
MQPAASLDPQSLVLPENASLFTRLRVAIRILKVIRGNEGNPAYGQTLNTSLNGGVYSSLSQKLKRSVEGHRLLSKRPSLEAKDLDLGALEALPEGTLGQTFARYFRDNKITPFETTLEIKNDVDYLAKRYRETHDLLHLVTGYGTDVMGEMELQAYVLGNLGLWTPALILTFSSMAALKKNETGVTPAVYLRRLQAAYQRGRVSPVFLGFWFEDHWGTPLPSLREQLCAPAQWVN